MSVLFEPVNVIFAVPSTAQSEPVQPNLPPLLGVCQFALVLDVAVNICPLVGAVAAPILIKLVAERSLALISNFIKRWVK